MKKIFFCLCTVLFTIILLGCEVKAKYNYLYEQSEITEIQIVEITEYITGDDGFTIPKLKTICVIDDIYDVIHDLSDIDCYSQYTDPLGVSIGSIGFKFQYDNGDYELICANGQARYFAGQKYQNYAGYRYFDDEQFKDLIDKYTELYINTED